VAKEQDTYWIGSAILDFTEGLYKMTEVNGVSRSDLARCLGVSPAYITKVLRRNINSSASQYKCWGLFRVDPERRAKTPKGRSLEAVEGSISPSIRWCVL